MNVHSNYQRRVSAPGGRGAGVSRLLVGWSRRAVASATILGAGLFGVAHTSLAEAQTPAKTPPPLYAYADGSASSATTCPETTTVASECPLQTALGLVSAGGTVLLATPGTTAPYYGNFTISTASTSSKKPVTIEPASGPANAVLDGDASGAVSCPTASCDDSVLTIGTGVYANLDSITIDDADNTVGNGGAINDAGTVALDEMNITGTQAANGGAVYLDNGAVLNITDSNISQDSAPNGDGGAIDSGDESGNAGTVTATNSTFDDETSYHDGAGIASGDHGGSGTLAVTDCTFSDDIVTYGDGGAIDSGDYSGDGSLAVTGSTFTDDSVSIDGGAIDSGDHYATGTLTVTGSKFTDDSAPDGQNAEYGDGGAIDSGDDSGMGSFVATDSTFMNNSADEGGAIASGDDAGAGTLKVAASTFMNNSGGEGGAIFADGLDSSVTVRIADSTFKDNTAADNGGAIDNGDFYGSDDSLTVSDSTFAGDSAYDGGGIENADDGGQSSAYVTDSTFSKDNAEFGGAIDNADFDGSGSLTLSSSTSTTNNATDGGAIDNGDNGGDGSLTVTFSTLIKNVATDGGAIDNGDNEGSGTVSIASSTLYQNGGYATLENVSGSLGIAGSIVAYSTNADCAGSITDAGYNFENTKPASCGFSTSNHDVVGGDPDLGPLAKNGGDTKTLKPTSKSRLLGSEYLRHRLQSLPEHRSAGCKDTRGRDGLLDRFSRSVHDVGRVSRSPIPGEADGGLPGSGHRTIAPARYAAVQRRCQPAGTSADGGRISRSTRVVPHRASGAEPSSLRA